MSKKRLYIIIAITAIITIGFFLAAYILSRDPGAAPTVEPRKSFFGNLFGGEPSGDTPRNGGDSTQGGPTDGTNGSTGTDNNPLLTQNNIPALRQISTTATSGYSPSLLVGKTSARFVERSTGNIFETAMESMRKDRISNALLPRVQESFFGNDGKSLVYRYIKSGASSILTFVRSVPNPDQSKVAVVGATSTNPITGSFLPEDVLGVAVSPDGKNMFYLTKSGDFDSHTGLGNVYNFQKNTSARVFQSPFSEWLPVFFDGKTAVLQTKASQDVPGYLYALNTATGDLQKIIGGINGLTTLPSPDLQKVLYSESTRGGLSLHLYDRKENTTSDISLITLPEKCVWNAGSTTLYCAAPDYIPSAEYPDSWYQGSVSFSDAVWKIDAKTRNVETVFLPGSFSAPKMDITNLTLSSSSDFLFFINKNDSTLWGYKLTQ